MGLPREAPPLKSIEILGVRVSCASRKDVLQLPLDWSTGKEQRTIFYVNAHCINLAAGDSIYRAVLNRVDLVYSDGTGVVWAARWLGGSSLEKVTGRDWIHDFSALAVEHDLRIYILASSPEINRAAVHNLRQQHPGLQIVGHRNGFFDPVETPEILAEINQCAPQIVWVGIGTPRQEKWLAAHREQIQAPVCWAVGALFDYVAGVEPPVPTWLNRLNLEWLWRMLVDPLGKWRRYLIGNPRFLYRIWRQKLGEY